MAARKTGSRTRKGGKLNAKQKRAIIERVIDSASGGKKLTKAEKAKLIDPSRAPCRARREANCQYKGPR